MEFKYKYCVWNSVLFTVHNIYPFKKFERTLKRVWYFITHRFQLLFWYRDRMNAKFSKHCFSKSVLLFKYIWFIYAFVDQMFWVIIYLSINYVLVNRSVFFYSSFYLRINKRLYVFGAQTWFSCQYELSLQISIWNMFTFNVKCIFRLNA